jgi:hypothetical protein
MKSPLKSSASKSSAPFEREKPVIAEEQDAKQGRKGYPVLYVLIGSLILAMIYVFVMMSWATSEG